VTSFPIPVNGVIKGYRDYVLTDQTDLTYWTYKIYVAKSEERM